MSDLRGLNEKGKKDYPKFRREQIEIPFCENCQGIQTVKKYQIIKKSGRTDEILLCDNCTKLVPDGVELLCLEIKTPKEELDLKVEKFENEGDSLLI